MSTLEELAESIGSREDLARFVRGLAKDLELNLADWTNWQLGDFLEALSGWIQDMEGYFVNTGQPVPEVPSWHLIGQMLLAARIYE
jgi:hypothetical protein